MDAVQVVRLFNFTGGVADEGRRDILGIDAGAVIADLDQLYTAGLDADGDLRCTGVDRVFQKLLDHRCRALHHLTGGDQLGGMLIQNMDDCHSLPSPVVNILCSAVQAAFKGLFQLVQKVQCFNGGKRFHIHGFQLFHHFAGYCRGIILLQSIKIHLLHFVFGG